MHNIDQSHRCCLLRRHQRTLVQQANRPRTPQESCQRLGSADSGQQANVYLGLADTRVARGEADITVQHGLEARPHSRSVNSGQQRL
jgi:hypothetical protein